MFTPPPSPSPSKMSFEKSAQVQPIPKEQQKQALGRRIKWAAILIPMVLIIIALSTRYITHGLYSPSPFELLVDLADQPPSPVSNRHSNWQLPHHKRQTASNSNSGSQSGPSTGSSTSTSATLAGTAQPLPTVPSTPPTLPTPFPQPWDQSLGQNFSSTSCFSFFTNMTNTVPFRACRPFSLLQSSSSAMIQAQNNLTLMNSIIYGTCTTSIPADQCAANMSWFTVELKTACAKDLQENNANAVDALTGLNAYTLMRTAACSVDPNTNTYCYLNAVHNSNPSDLYYYNLALGLKLPKSAVPTCSSCTKNLMGLYYSALVDPTQYSNTKGGGTVEDFDRLSSAYPGASDITTKACGGNFAKSSVGNGALSSSLPLGLSWPLAALSISWLLS